MGAMGWTGTGQSTGKKIRWGRQNGHLPSVLTSSRNKLSPPSSTHCPLGKRSRSWDTKGDDSKGKSLIFFERFLILPWSTNLSVSFFSGGFGVAKNLSTWATQGKNCTVSKEVEDVLKAFHAAKKPIGLCCISPVLAAKIFPGCELTVGHDTECEK